MAKMFSANGADHTKVLIKLIRRKYGGRRSRYKKNVISNAIKTNMKPAMVRLTTSQLDYSLTFENCCLRRGPTLVCLKIL